MFDIEKLFSKFFDIAQPTHKDKWVDVMTDMAVHAYGWKPKELIEKQRPNEPNNIQKYRVENYRPITKRGINKATDKLSSIFSQSGFVVKTDQSTLDYIDQEIFETDTFETLNLYQYFEKVVIPDHIVDPNGLIVVNPGEAKEVNEKREPKIQIVPSARIMHLNSEFFSFLSDEKSEVTKNRKKVMEGEVYHIYTKDSFYKLVQVGNILDKKFVGELVYFHDLGVLPFVIMGGIKQKGLYKSFFDSYLPYADEAIVEFSDYQAVRVLSAFPVKEMAAIECDFKGCGGRGYIGENLDDICRKCNGTGSYVPVSPFDILMRSEKSAAMGEQIDTRPMLQYHTPPVDILKFIDDAWKSSVEEAERSLNLIFVDASQSGVAKAIDREDSDTMLNKIASNLFDNLMTNVIYFIGLYRKEINEKPIILRPSSFRIKTESELSEELGFLVEKGAPLPFIVEATKDLSTKRFSGDEVTKRVFEVLPLYDPLFGLSVAEKMQLNVTGATTVEEVRKSQLAYQMIQELMQAEGREVIFEPFSGLKIMLDEIFSKQRNNPIIDGA